MGFLLNNEQAKALASFFFDVAKGLVLGGIGFSALSSLESKIAFVLASLLVAFGCVRMGLALLEDRK